MPCANRHNYDVVGTAKSWVSFLKCAFMKNNKSGTNNKRIKYVYIVKIAFRGYCCHMSNKIIESTHEKVERLPLGCPLEKNTWLGCAIETTDRRTSSTDRC